MKVFETNLWCNKAWDIFIYLTLIYNYRSLNWVRESIWEFVFDRDKCFVNIWYTPVWSTSNLQADAAFIIEISSTASKVWTGLAWCPEAITAVQLHRYAINRHSNIIAQGLIKDLGQVVRKIRTEYCVLIDRNCCWGKQAVLYRLLSHPILIPAEQCCWHIAITLTATLPW